MTKWILSRSFVESFDEALTRERRQMESSKWLNEWQFTAQIGLGRWICGRAQGKRKWDRERSWPAHFGVSSNNRTEIHVQSFLSRWESDRGISAAWDPQAIAVESGSSLMMRCWSFLVHWVWDSIEMLGQGDNKQVIFFNSWNHTNEKSAILIIKAPKGTSVIARDGNNVQKQCTSNSRMVMKLWMIVVENEKLVIQNHGILPYEIKILKLIKEEYRKKNSGYQGLCCTTKSHPSRSCWENVDVFLPRYSDNRVEVKAGLQAPKRTRQKMNGWKNNGWTKTERMSLISNLSFLQLNQNGSI